ncbi:hypothetical protein DL93DRAFT_1838016 [Clavulina sp. PMI_390]|nr:hypothetical protein DL93DRAFT_1838016 [Clavulina sp. PMI_390]
MPGYFSPATLQSLEGNLASLSSTPLPHLEAQHILETAHGQRSSRAVALENDILEVDSSIESILAIYNPVMALLHTLRSRRNTLVHALRSPIQALPLSVIKRLFKTVVLSEVRDSCLYPAIILSHVCSAWRSIVLAMPELWSTAEVNGTEALRELVRRSHPLPLDLSIAYAPRIGRNSTGIRVPKDVPWNVLMDSEDVKRISSLRVQGPSLLGRITIPNDIEPSDLLYFKLMDQPSVQNEHAVPLALHSPRVLEFNLWHRVPAVDMFQGAWPRLQQLNIRNCSTGAVNAILGSMEAPLLDRLEFHDMEHYALPPATFPPKFGVRSVSMSNSAKFASQFRRWLDKFPALELIELHLEGNYMSSNWWNLVSLRRGGWV